MRIKAIAFVLTGETLGFMAILGIISLFGIVLNNAIVLIERIQIELEKPGCSLSDALIFAAKHRTRPILLTAVTTLCGLFPLYLFGGSLWRALAVAIGGGLLFSTVLTLVVVPALYLVMYRKEFAG